MRELTVWESMPKHCNRPSSSHTSMQAIFILSCLCYAAGINVTTEFLFSGYNSTEAGGTLELLGGSFTDVTLRQCKDNASARCGIMKPIKIECITGDPECIVDGLRKHACLAITGVGGTNEEVILKGLRIKEGKSEEPGGALFIEDSTVSLIEVTIRDNEAQFGGGIWVEHSTVMLTLTRLVNNFATHEGGGMHAISSDISIVGCYFNGNAASSASDLFADEFCSVSFDRCPPGSKGNEGGTEKIVIVFEGTIQGGPISHDCSFCGE